MREDREGVRSRGWFILRNWHNWVKKYAVSAKPSFFSACRVKCQPSSQHMGSHQTTESFGSWQEKNLKLEFVGERGGEVCLGKQCHLDRGTGSR